MDEVDYGARCAEHYREIAMRNHRSQSAKGLKSAENCAECGDPIPKERRRLVPGCQLCVICQTLAERE